MNLKSTQKLLILFGCFVCLISGFTLTSYPGHTVVYILFTIVFNVLFIGGFTERRIFFDTFMGIFFWLGFWLKFSVRVAFMGGEFQAAEQIGEFTGSGTDFDHALLVSSVAIIALLIATLIRRKWFFSYTTATGNSGLREIFAFYKKHRRIALVSFAILFTVIAATNVLFGIYQRGSVPKTILPFKLGGIYTWLLLFGLASISAVILDCEFKLRNNPYAVTILSFSESFFSNVSMLSRGMILNGSALLLGLKENWDKHSILTPKRFKYIILVVFLGLFVISVFSVNHLRKSLFYTDFPVDTGASKSFVAKHLQTSIQKFLKERPQPPKLQTRPKFSVRGSGNIYIYKVKLIFFKSNVFIVDLLNKGKLICFQIKLFIFNTLETMSHLLIEALINVETLLLDRWLGIEGVMAVSSYSHLGWDLWKAGWQERYTPSGTSMYDVKILKSPFANMSRHHFISLPVIVAFLYYPGSFIFLFISMLVVGLLAGAIEMMVYKFSGGNFILCSLIAQAIAYRYASFGYVPYQSYLLFGSIVLNIFIIYFTDRLLFCFKKSENRNYKPEAIV
jgi:hypothetical protein